MLERFLLGKPLPKYSDQAYLPTINLKQNLIKNHNSLQNILNFVFKDNDGNKCELMVVDFKAMPNNLRADVWMRIVEEQIESLEKREKMKSADKEEIEEKINKEEKGKIEIEANGKKEIEANGKKESAEKGKKESERKVENEKITSAEKEDKTEPKNIKQPNQPNKYTPTHTKTVSYILNRCRNKYEGFENEIFYVFIVVMDYVEKEGLKGVEGKREEVQKNDQKNVQKNVQKNSNHSNTSSSNEENNHSTNAQSTIQTATQSTTTQNQILIDLIIFLHKNITLNTKKLLFLLKYLYHKDLHHSLHTDLFTLLLKNKQSLIIFLDTLFFYKLTVPNLINILLKKCKYTDSCIFFINEYLYDQRINYNMQKKIRIKEKGKDFILSNGLFECEIVKMELGMAQEEIRIRYEKEIEELKEENKRLKEIISEK